MILSDVFIYTLNNHAVIFFSSIPFKPPNLSFYCVKRSQQVLHWKSIFRSLRATSLPLWKRGAARLRTPCSTSTMAVLNTVRI